MSVVIVVQSESEGREDESKVMWGVVPPSMECSL